MNMNTALINFLTPSVLFFFLGMIASALRVSLAVPSPIPKFLSLYLLFVIGFDGGVELSRSGLSVDILTPLLFALTSSVIIPIYSFFILRTNTNVADSAEIAASYGSVSGVTFITAINLLQTLGISFGGYMVAVMALMESPAIITSLLLARSFSAEGEIEADSSVLRDAFLNGAVFLILGSFIIGWLTGDTGLIRLKPFTHGIFKGMLSFFMLDMGIVAVRRMKDLSQKGIFIFLFSTLLPLFNGLCAVGICYLTSMPLGDALLFTVLLASASYIAVPAAMRLTLPQANPGLYIPMALGITLPLNIIIGLPLYLHILKTILLP